jgi:hypothetical protein
MSEEKNQPDQEETEREMTPEEYAEMRKKMLAYYKEQLAFLQPQKEYETLLADIEEARARRMTMTIRLTQMTTPQQEAPKSERKLKAD